MRVVCTKNISENLPSPLNNQTTNLNYSGRVVVYENVKIVQIAAMTDATVYQFTFEDNTTAYVLASEYSISVFGGIIDE